LKKSACKGAFFLDMRKKIEKRKVAAIYIFLYFISKLLLKCFQSALLKDFNKTIERHLFIISE